MYSQPPAAVDTGIQDTLETSDDLSSSYFNEDGRRSQKERPESDFDSIRSPQQVKDSVTAGSDDEMYENNSFSARQRWSSSHLQPEVTPVVRTPERVRLSSIKSPESLNAMLDGNFKEEGRTVESERRPVRFRNDTSPFGRCSQLNMQGTLNCGQRKQPDDKDRTWRNRHQPYGSSVFGEDIREIEALSSDDSSDSSKRCDVKKRSSERTAKRSSIEIEQRVTRSKTQSSHGLPLSAKKKATQDALDALRRRKDSVRR